MLADTHFNTNIREVNSSLLKALYQNGLLLVEGVDHSTSNLSVDQKAMISRIIDLEFVESKNIPIQGWDIPRSERGAMYQVYLHFLSLIADKLLKSLELGRFDEEQFRHEIIQIRNKVAGELDASIMTDYQKMLTDWEISIKQHDPFDPQKITNETGMAYFVYLHLRFVSIALNNAYFANEMKLVRLRDTTLVEKIQKTVADSKFQQVFILAGRNHLLTKTIPPQLNPQLKELMDKENLRYSVFYVDKEIQETTEIYPGTAALGQITNIDILNKLDNSLQALDRYFDAFKIQPAPQNKV